MRFPFGQTVTLHTRSVTGQDDYGNDVYGQVDTVVDGVPVWPRNSSERIQGQDVLIVGLSAVLPEWVDPTHIDTVTVAGKVYKIDGEPGDYRQSPLTGNGIGWQINLTRYSG